MPEDNPYAKIYADALKDQPGAPPAPPTVVDPSMGDMVGMMGRAIGKFGENALEGLGESALGAVGGLGKLGHAIMPKAVQDSAYGKDMAAGTDELKRLATPDNKTQGAMKGVGDAAQFFIPGEAEEAAASHLPALGKLAAPMTRMVGSEAINDLQGGPVGGGAAGSMVGEGIGAGMRTIAPHAAETAMRIPSKDKAFGRTPGAAILEDTKGILPSTIGASAKDRISQLMTDLEGHADAASVRPTPRIRGFLQPPVTEKFLPVAGGEPGQVQGVMRTRPEMSASIPPPFEENASASLGPARSIIQNASGKAERENAPNIFNQYQPMQSQLNTRFSTGEPIPENVTPRDLLNLKRGFSKENLGAWNPDVHKDVTSTGRQAYHAMDQEFDRTVPGAAETNQRVSSLIPVERAADKAERAPSLFQRTAGRVGAHTGALTSAVGGAMLGAHSGIPGAGLVGGAAGLLLPELTMSPETQMMVARTLGNKTLQSMAPPLAAAVPGRVQNLMKYIRESQ